jgi:hypothetical protein
MTDGSARVAADYRYLVTDHARELRDAEAAREERFSEPSYGEHVLESALAWEATCRRDVEAIAADGWRGLPYYAETCARADRRLERAVEAIGRVRGYIAMAAMRRAA